MNFMNEQDPKPEKKIEESEDGYSFMNETVKPPPPDVTKLRNRILKLIGAGAVFGLAAGLIFRFTSGIGEQSPVRIPEDTVSESISESAESQTESSESSAGSTDSDESADTESVPPVDPAEEALDHYKLAYEKMREIAETAQSSLVTVSGITSSEDWFHITDTDSRSASGLVIAENGQSLLILTDHRVVDGADRIAVTLPGGTIADASYLKHDPVTELTIIRVPLSEIPAKDRSRVTTANLGNSYGVSYGSPVIAVGAPIGEPDSFAFGMILSTSGIRTVTDGEYNLFATDINGSSNGSGILINLDGQVVGFILQEFAPNDSGSITAVPISPLKSLIELLSNNKPLPYIGIEGQNVTHAVSQETDIPEGIYVTSVEADSPALATGLMPGDIIVSVDDSKTISLRLLHDRLMNKAPGDTMKIGIQRLGAGGYVDFTFTLSVGEAVATSKSTDSQASGSSSAESSETGSGQTKSESGDSGSSESAESSSTGSAPAESAPAESAPADKKADR